jgi:hypothetical protein
VLVVVVPVDRMAVSIVDEVDVVAVGQGLVSAVIAVDVVMRLGDDMDVLDRALVVVVAVARMRMPVVEVVDVPLVLDGRVSTVRGVAVEVVLVGDAGRHDGSEGVSKGGCLATVPTS